MAQVTPPIDLVERFIAPPSDRPRDGTQIFSWIKGALKEGQVDQVKTLFPRLALPGLDYTTATSLVKLLGRLRAQAPTPENALRLAVVGGFTTHQLVGLIDLFLYAGGIDAQIYEADYGTLHQEFLDPHSGLSQFRPDHVVILTTWRNLGHKPELTDDRAAVQAKVDAEVSDWSTLWRAAHDRLGCQIVQNNFDVPPWRTLANLETKHSAGLGRFIALVNQGLQEAVPPYVTIHDVDHLAASVGRWEWSDDRFYHHAKLPCGPEHLADYAHSVASLILAQSGLGKKCLVLDLDNTLWGGVIGDDGLGGIKVGQGDPESEAFLAFQRYVKALGRRGVILAVCSKNTDAVAREVFEKHPEMALRMDDIACFIANWDDKATNLGRIAAELNIGINSLVFVDDNPVERSIVRRLRPEVAVPEMPADPAYYIRALDSQRYFQAVTISSEDLKRTDFYRADGARKALESSTEDLNGFLESLELVARIGPVVPATLERTVQLISRSNQFNLTKRNYSNADVLAMLGDPTWVTRTIALEDRFGDNGLISVMFAKKSGGDLVIDTWLMSCRVLKRGVEHFLLAHLVAHAKEQGLSRLVGEYIPTSKNGLVRDHYSTLGFTQIDGDASGHTHWALPVAGWQPHPTFIREIAIDG